MLLEVWRDTGGYYADYMDRLGRHRRLGLIAHTPADASQYIARLLHRHRRRMDRITVLAPQDVLDLVGDLT